MSSDLVKCARSFCIHTPLSKPLITKLADRIEELEAKMELIQEEWAGAVYGDLENGVASLNAAAATDFYKRYPLVSSFGETLNRIIDGDKDE